jgi:hypothetical protein
MYDQVMTVMTLEATKERLASGFADVCGHLNVLHEQMVALTAELLESSAWEGSDCRSAEQWLAWQTGLSPERARQIVLIARRRAELPVTFAAFAEGLLSVDQVAVVARRAPAHNDREACELAQSATVAQLRLGLSKHFVTHPYPAADPSNPSDPGDPSNPGDPGDPRDPADPAAPAGGASKPESSVIAHRLTCGFEDDGDFFLHAVANGVDGAVIQRALAEAKDALFRAGNTDATWLDALVELSRRSLDAIGSVSRREMYKVIVHLDTDGAWVHDGPAVPPSLLEHLICDGIIQPLWSTAGRPINMGRAQHIVPLRTRRVVEDRDRMCRHPACASSTYLQVHHIFHWIRGGRTDTDNLVCLCGRHHRAHHCGEFTIAGNADDPTGLTFRDAAGHVIAGSGSPRPPGDRCPPAPPQPYAHPTGERLQLRWLSFLPPPDHHDSN